MDYPEQGAKKSRSKSNKEALREFIGTHLAGNFLATRIKNKKFFGDRKSGPHALLACGWKNGLQELKEFLYGGKAPDWNGVLVRDPNDPIKRSKRINGLGKNLIFNIAISDRDATGKEAQNKGFADNAFFGFDDELMQAGEYSTV